MFLIGNEKYDNLKSWIIRGNYVANWMGNLRKIMWGFEETVRKIC